MRGCNDNKNLLSGKVLCVSHSIKWRKSPFPKDGRNASRRLQKCQKKASQIQAWPVGLWWPADLLHLTPNLPEWKSNLRVDSRYEQTPWRSDPNWNRGAEMEGIRFTKNCTRYSTLSLVTVCPPTVLNCFHILLCQNGFQGVPLLAVVEYNVRRFVWLLIVSFNFISNRLSWLLAEFYSHSRASGENKNRGSDGKP